MADVNGVNYALQHGTTPPDRVESAYSNGRVKVMYDSYEASSAAAGTDVLLGKLKEGAVILDWKVIADDLGTGVTGQLATRDEDDGTTENTFSQALDLASAASINEPAAADIDELPLAVDEDVDVLLKIAGGTATGTIKVFIYYSID